jgi:hypothetical protein
MSDILYETYLGRVSTHKYLDVTNVTAYTNKYSAK